MKKFKAKKKIDYKVVIILIIAFFCVFIWLSYLNLNSSHSTLINYILNDFDKKKDYSFNFLTSNLDNLFKTYSFKKKIDIVYNDNSPLIYLYNTHDKEKYIDNTTIYEATSLLKDNLKKLGIKAIQEEKNVSEYLHTGLSNYDISRNFILDVKEKKNISYYIDIHRDSVDNTTITINNKKYAKIMFVLGLENENYLKNKIVMEKMNNYLNSNYPGLSKGIYEKKGSSVDGVYNQDIDENVILIEIGGVSNNKEEINNSTEIIALMLYSIIGD